MYQTLNQIHHKINHYIINYFKLLFAKLIISLIKVNSISSKYYQYIKYYNNLNL
jgi:hypothetical protein